MTCCLCNDAPLLLADGRQVQCPECQEREHSQLVRHYQDRVDSLYFPLKTIALAGNVTPAMIERAKAALG